MSEATYIRKLDSMGRIMIPIRLRETFGMVTGREYPFSVMEKNGHRYICIDCGPVDTTGLEAAIKLVEDSGLKVSKRNSD